VIRNITGGWQVALPGCDCDGVLSDRGCGGTYGAREELCGLGAVESHVNCPSRSDHGSVPCPRLLACSLRRRDPIRAGSPCPERWAHGCGAAVCQAASAVLRFSSGLEDMAEATVAVDPSAEGASRLYSSKPRWSSSRAGGNRGWAHNPSPGTGWRGFPINPTKQTQASCPSGDCRRQLQDGVRPPSR
jgi:hypothetical protein